MSDLVKARRLALTGIEVWAPIPGLGDRYEVSNLGRVRSLYYRNRSADKRRETPLILKPGRTGKNRPAVTLPDQEMPGRRVTRMIHRLVMLAFEPCGDPTQVVAHLDGDEQNNRLCNLVWASPHENEAHKELHGTKIVGSRAHAAKLTEADIPVIRGLSAAGLTSFQIGARYAIHPTAIQKILSGKAWRHVSEEATP